jgi:Zn-finger nucleic acid-binding protein
VNCPHCNVELRLAERKNIEIDYCPKCRGVWLDRGELDKLLETSETEHRPRNDRDDDDRYERERPSHDSKYKYKRKSLLGEIFDF